MKTVNELNVLLRVFILCFKNVLAVPHCFIKMFSFQQSYGILYSLWCDNFCCAYHELKQGDFYSFDHDQEKVSFLSNYLLPTQKKNLPQEKLRNYAYLIPKYPHAY